MKKAIVTGSNGFVGSALVKELINRDVEVIALVREGKCNNVPQDLRVRIEPFDLSKASLLRDSIKARDADVFFHLAWSGSAGSARSDTLLQLQNAQWTVDCLRVAKEIGCSRFVCAGSIMEHEAIVAAFTRENRPGPGYIYGSGKLAAHTMCMSVAADIGIDLVWGEITNAYGPGEVSARFVNSTIRKILRNDPLTFTSGEQNYDFVFITDVARAFYLISENGKPFCSYLIGSSNAKPLRQFILEMKQSLAPDKEFIFGDVPFTGISLPLDKYDCLLTEQETGFRAEVSFSDGIRSTIEWIRGKVNEEHE